MPPDSIADYDLCGWRLRSDIALPELRPWSTDLTRPVDVRVALGTVEPIPCPVQVSASAWTDGRGNLLIEDTDGSRILAQGASSVIVQVGERQNWVRIRLYLLSFVMAFVGYRRDALAFHAAVVEIRGNAIALCGASGAGKSTLATLLVARGHPLLTDDVAIVARAPGSPAIVQPGFPHIKITENTAHALGIAVNHPLNPGGAERGKHLLPVTERFCRESRPLAAVLILTEQDGEVTIRQLSAFEALENKKAMLYRTELAYGLAEHELVGRFLALLQAIPVFRFSRPKDGARLHETAAAVEAFSQGLSDCRVPFAG